MSIWKRLARMFAWAVAIAAATFAITSAAGVLEGLTQTAIFSEPVVVASIEETVVASISAKLC